MYATDLTLVAHLTAPGGTLDTVIGSRDKLTQGGRQEGDIVLSPQLVTHKYNAHLSWSFWGSRSIQ